MIKNVLIFTFLFISFKGISQENCQFNADGYYIAKGKTKTITHKTSYGGQYTSVVRVGLWQLFNEDMVKMAEGEYKYKDESSNKNGVWNYYSNESVLLFKRWYVSGLVEKTQFYDSGFYAHENDTVLIVSDSMGSLKIEERKGKFNYKYTTTPLLILNGDPGRFAKIEKAKTLEIADIRHTDDEILQKFPVIHSTLNLRSWAVNNTYNLINNPDFETMRDNMWKGQAEQIKPGEDILAKYWSSASETPDIFFDGDNCFAGYRVYGVNYEVLRNELKEPLKAGTTYCLQFKLKLKMENAYAINGVSVTISKTPMGFKTPDDGIKNGVVLQTHKSLPLACRERWMTISGNFTATGGEKYLYFGNFTPKDELKIFSLDAAGYGYIDEIYYYIDDVVLLEQKKGTTRPCNADGCDLKTGTKDTIEVTDNIYTSPKVGQTLVLRNIQFETGKWELLESSFKTLDSLLTLMQQFPNMKVEISGYTDSRGNAADNQVLSFNRAYAVATYLIDYGIEEARITYQGLGQANPIDTNATESGRLNNRRVEFKVIEL